MKIVLDIDNDSIMAFAALANIKGKAKERLMEFICKHDEINVDTSILGEESEAQMNLLGASIIITHFARHEND